jgi:hypothetical protein
MGCARLKWFEVGLSSARLKWFDGLPSVLTIPSSDFAFPTSDSVSFYKYATPRGAKGYRKTVKHRISTLNGSHISPFTAFQTSFFVENAKFKNVSQP